ncbi:MAG: hypothetical protein HOV76_31860, partial [Hamadaea sp.]|nr:hypothetical protein [Hamadaea sp.]
VEHRHDRPGPGEVSYEQPQDGPLFLRMSIVATTALALAKAHVPARAAEPCERCGRPSPCPTAVHAREVVRLSMPRPLTPAAEIVQAAASGASTGRATATGRATSTGEATPAVRAASIVQAAVTGSLSKATAAGAPDTTVGRSMLGLLDEEP